MEITHTSNDKWMSKEVVAYILIECYSSRSWNIAVAFNLDGIKGYILSKISQSEKEKYWMASLIYNI